MAKHLVLNTIAPLPFVLLILVSAGRFVQTANNGISSNQSSQQASQGITTQHIFVRALAAAHVPGGFIWMMKCSGEEPVFHDERVILPLHDALESLTKMDPRYKWQIEGGVVNLLPARSGPPLLKVRIGQYKVNTDLNGALKQLLALREIKEGAARLGLKQNTMTLLLGSSPLYDNSSSIKVDIRNVSLREALNALVMAHGRAIWEYREYRCNRANEFSVDFLAQ